MIVFGTASSLLATWVLSGMTFWQWVAAVVGVLVGAVVWGFVGPKIFGRSKLERDVKTLSEIIDKSNKEISDKIDKSNNQISDKLDNSGGNYF